jgi:TonB family protein
MKYALVILALATSLFAQTDNTAPVVWERYRHSDLDLSINLPKMPVVISNYDTCKEELKRSGYAYAEGAVYEFTVVAGGIRQGVRPRICSTDPPSFDQSTIDQRLEQLRQVKGVIETKTRVGQLDSFRFNEERSFRILVPDVAHKRWIELAVVHYAKEIPDTDRFIGSIQFDASAGKEIGDGATQALGDPMQEQATTNPVTTDQKLEKDAVVTQIVIAAKPHARYTDEARKANEQGTVRLKIVLQANGAVGTITPMTELKHGLTERAIAAARKLVFLPARVNNVPISKVITIEYRFSIY